jgi:hypothetical protein
MSLRVERVIHSATAALLLTVRGAAAQSAPDLANSLKQQVLAQGLLPWSAHTPLLWSDFRGPPRLGSNTAAQTSSSITYLIQCHDSAAVFAVLATFWTAQSWVRPDVVARSTVGARTMLHERTDFDITEVFARRLRRALATADALCPSRLNEARRLFDQLHAANEELQDRYDRETAHGLAREPQARWDASIRASLDSLAAYAVPPRQGSKS